MDDQTKYCAEKTCEQQFIFTAAEQKFFAAHGLKAPKRCKDCRAKKREAKGESKVVGGKVWSTCDQCQNETWTVAETGMCGPCTFGEAETINGNW